jgi:hypothetical protein
MHGARLAAIGLMALGGSAFADVSSDTALMTDGFDVVAGGSIHGRGIWEDPRALFRLQNAGAAQSGLGFVRVDTTEFGDYNMPGFRNRWGGWIGYAQGRCGFAPAESGRSVLTVRGFVRVAMPTHGLTRDVRAALVLDDATNSAIAEVGMDSGGLIGGVVVFDGSELMWRTAEPVALASEWNEIVIRLDLTSGLGRIEWNGSVLLVFSHTAGAVERVQLVADGRRSGVMPLRPQGSADFDSVSMVASWHCPGDLNLDRVVDDLDFESFVRMYDRGACTNMEVLDASCAADFNGDRTVDELDFGVFVARYDVFVCARRRRRGREGPALACDWWLLRG